MRPCECGCRKPSCSAPSSALRCVCRRVDGRACSSISEHAANMAVYLTGLAHGRACAAACALPKAMPKQLRSARFAGGVQRAVRAAAKPGLSSSDLALMTDATEVATSDSGAVLVFRSACIRQS
eukprot:1528842-Pleurochrysis_carterae.AAC.1